MKRFQRFLAVSLLICLMLSCSGFWGKKKKKEEPVKSAEPEIVEVVEAEVQQPPKNVEEVEKIIAEKKAVEKAATPAPVVIPAPTPAPAPVVKVKPVDPNATVVTVDGDVITEGQLQVLVGERIKQIGNKIPPAMIEQYKSQIRKQAIEQVIVENILSKKIEAADLTVTDEAIEQEILSQISSQNLSLDDFKALLQAYGKTYKEHQENIRKRLLFNKLLEKELGDEMAPPTVEQAQEYYNNNAARFKKPESIHVSHILFGVTGTDPNSDPNVVKAEAKAKAESVLAQIKGGADFATLAKENSSCPSAEKGGDLGMAPKGSFMPAFEAAAYALEPNEVSDVVETRFGYHIIKLKEKQAAGVVTFDEAKDQILMQLEQQSKQGAVMKYIDKVKSAATIEYANPADKMDMSAMRPPARAPK